MHPNKLSIHASFKELESVKIYLIRFDHISQEFLWARIVQKIRTVCFTEYVVPPIITLHNLQGHDHFVPSSAHHSTSTRWLRLLHHINEQEIRVQEPQVDHVRRIVSGWVSIIENQTIVDGFFFTAFMPLLYPDISNCSKTIISLIIMLHSDHFCTVMRCFTGIEGKWVCNLVGEEGW